MASGLLHREADRSALDTFRATSGRFLFARRGDGELEFLEQGTADLRRAEARTSLRCPEPGCPSPAITTVSRAPGGARDGFRHLVGPGGSHQPEGMFHRQAKALVQRWARGLPGVESAQQEVAIGGGTRVADLLLTLRGGAQLAVEIQYAGLSVAAWRERTECYQRLGIGVTWLWGHLGAQAPLLEKWREPARTQVCGTSPALWINPAEEQVAWAWDLLGLEQPPMQPGRPHYRLGTLDDLEVHPAGLLPPGFRDAVAQRCEQVDQAEAKRQADLERARQRQAAADARREAFYARDDSPPGPKQRVAGPPRVPEPGRPSCRRCGGALDPALKASGVHVDPFCDRAW